MTDKEELKQAINTLKRHCNDNYSSYSENHCAGCMFEDCCMNRWCDYDTLNGLMNGLLEDMATAEKMENTDFGAAYDAVQKLVCENFDECKGCPFFNRDEDCPVGQLDSVMVNY